SISPGPVNTNFQAASHSPPDFVARAVADVPMKRLGEPEEIAELVLFMCSDACEYMTANTVYVNGGGGFRESGMTVIGVDFGTTNSVVTRLEADGSVSTVRHRFGTAELDVIRSVLCFWNDGARNRVVLRSAAG